MIHVNHALHYALPNAGAAKDNTTLVLHFHDIAHLDATFFSIFGIDPNGLIHIPVPAFHLAGDHFAAPANIVRLRMNTPATMVGHEEQRIGVGPPTGQPLIVHGALLDPFWNGRTLQIVRIALRDPLG